MKKVVLLVVFSTICMTASFAQSRVGGFLGYGSEIERWGIGVNGEFFLNEKMSLAPSLLFFFPEENSGVKTSFWELNGNFQYYFLAEDAVSIYGIAGLNLLNYKVKVDGSFGSGSDSGSELGLNLGIGANFNVGNVLPFAELKYVAGDADQAVINLGVKFPLSGE